MNNEIRTPDILITKKDCKNCEAIKAEYKARGEVPIEVDHLCGAARDLLTGLTALALSRTDVGEIRLPILIRFNPDPQVIPLAGKRSGNCDGEACRL